MVFWWPKSFENLWNWDKNDPLENIDSSSFKLPYGKFINPEEDDWDQNNQDKTEKQKLYENNKYYPIIEKLYENGELTQDTYDNIKSYIAKNPPESNFNDVEMLNDEREILEECIEKLWSETENINNFWEDIENLEEFENYDINLDSEWLFDIDILNLIWKNYLRFNDIEWNSSNLENNSNIKWDISTAIKLTQNNILQEIKNIPKTSQTYKTALINISSWNLEKQLEWINSLYVLAYSNEWTLWKKDFDNYIAKRKGELMIEATKISFLIWSAKENNNQRELEALKKRKIAIIGEANEITLGEDIKSWDIFNSWELDKNSDKSESSEENV